MRKIYLLTLLFVSFQIVSAQAITTPSIAPSKSFYCVGDSITITYTITGASANANVYVQFTKNSFGSFINIDAINVDTGTFVTGYRIKPVDVTNSGKLRVFRDGFFSDTYSQEISFNVNDTITTKASLAAATFPVCQGTSVTFTAKNSGGGIDSNFTFFVNNIQVQSGAGKTYTYAPGNGDQIKVKVTTKVGCQTNSGDTTIVAIVNPIHTISTSGNASQNICANVPITNTVFVIGGGATGTSQSGSLPAGVTYNPGTLTLSGTPTSSGIFNYAINTSGNGCGSKNIAGTITVSPNDTIKLKSGSGSLSQGVCPGTAIAAIRFDLSGGAGSCSVVGTLPAGISSSFVSGTFTIAGTPTVTGIYNYKVVTTPGTCKADTLSGTITVYPSPVAAFVINDTAQCFQGNSFIFKDSVSTVSSGTIQGYAWSFGAPNAANTSTLSTYTTTFANIGSTGVTDQSVTLTVTSSNTCTNSITKIVHLYAMPIVSLSTSRAGNEVCQNDTITIFNTPSGFATKYDWNFGDNTTGTNSNSALHSYANYSAPAFLVTLKASNYSALSDSGAKGCPVSNTISIKVNPLPVVSFTINDTLQCNQNDAFVFTSTSTVFAGTGSTIANHKWNFGDASTGIGATANHSYASVNTYNVTLLDSTNKGCVASLSKNVVVYNNPQAAITSSSASDTVCSGTAISLNTNAGFTYTWSTGGTSSSIDLNTTTGSTPTTTLYNVTITDNNNCSGTTSRSITVKPSPQKPLAANDHGSAYCSGAKAQNFFVANAEPGLSYFWTTSPTGTVIYGADKPACKLDLPSSANPSFLVIVTATNTYGCAQVDSDQVAISSNVPPTSGIIKSQNTLICANNSVDSYQWGFTDASTFTDDTLAGETFQNYLAESNPDKSVSGKYYWVIISKDGCENKIYYESPSGSVSAIGNTFQQSIKVYPNPFNSTLTISDLIVGENLRLEVYDLVGKLQQNYTTDGSSSFSINTQNWNAGLYFISIADNNGNKALVKIIKQ